MLTISVIIPVYNTAEYLEKCLESVINQTYRNLEIIIVNDCSSDSSDIICRDYSKRDGRIRYFLNEQNMGVSFSRNRALSEAKGDYFLFVDSDDWLDVTMIEKMVEKCDSSFNDVIMCDAYKVMDNDMDRLSYCRFVHESNTGKDIYRAVLSKSGTLWNKLIGRTCLEDAFFDEKISYGEDLFFLYLIKNKISVVRCVKEPLYYYRYLRSGNVVSSLLNEKYIDYMKVTGIISDFLIRSGLTFEGMSRLSLCQRTVYAAARDELRLSKRYAVPLSNMLMIGKKRAYALIWHYPEYRRPHLKEFLIYRAGCRNVEKGRQLFLKL